MRAAYRAQMLPAITDVFLIAQRGFLDVGFIGGAQIDRYGNLNTSAIGGYARPEGAAAGQRRRQRHHLALPRGDHPHRPREAPLRRPRGLHHEPRLSARAATRAGGAGSLFGGVSRVVTTLGIFGFEPGSRRMRLEAVLRRASTVEEVRDQTPASTSSLPERVAHDRAADATTSWPSCARSTPSASSSALPRGRS